ncbi:MAG: DMT family transporter [bacterium]|nr:DMT family transporter [bacterium]
MSQRSLAITALVVATIIWGAAAPIFKWALGNIPPFSLAFLRFYLAVILLLPFCFRFLKIKKSDLIPLIFAGLLGVSLNIGFFFLGIQRTLAINSSVITMAVPILTIFAAVIFLKEELTGKIISATALSTLGIILIITLPLLKEGLTIQLLGDFFLVLAALSWVGYEILSKKLFRQYSPITITFYSFLVGSLTFLPLALYEYNIDPSWISRVDARGIIGVIYGIFFASITAYFAWQWGLSKLPASEAGLFFHLNPVINVLVAMPLLGEKITSPFIAGAILVGVSVYLAEHKRVSHPLHATLDKKG